jgi:UDP-N-acetylglucosamine 3-dehydrogenase
MVRIGILSFAHMHAASYAAGLRRHPGAELAGIWDDDPARGAEFARQFDAPFFDDLDALLGSGLDGVIVTAENVNHRHLTERAAAAGLWVLSEKPLATTVEDARAMIDACRAAGVGLGTAFPCRHSPPLMAAHRRITSGEFGDILAVSCTNNGSYPGGWFGDLALSGGGATMDHTVHVIDLLRWMLGREFTRVYCENGNLTGRDTPLDDTGVLLLEMEGGVKVSHIASWNRARSYPTWGDVTLEFIGTGGVLRVDAFNQKIALYNDKAMRASWIGWGGDMDEGLVNVFIAAVADRREPTITGHDGLKAVEVTVAAYRSAATASAITL